MAYFMMERREKQGQIYTVSGLTVEIQELLEEKFPFVWVTGEISNFRVPASGHFYFTLKDAEARISAVMFRGQNRTLKFTPEDGMHITGLGRITVYGPHGNYQLVLEFLEPEGLGQLQAAFEQLKAKLAAEGLFDLSRKKPIPFLPRKISIITSPTGSVIRDIINVASRRFSNIRLEIFPVKVQGDGADREIAEAFRHLGERMDTDVIILARGGGSLEDLQAFNSEIVARAIADSEIPIISGVGHETDFTIADLVADLRAPTPSAAAELAVPLKSELSRQIENLSRTLVRSLDIYIKLRRERLVTMTRRLIHPRKKMDMLRLRVDDLATRMIGQMRRRIREERERATWRSEKLADRNPLLRILHERKKIAGLEERLYAGFRQIIHRKDSRFRELAAGLKALDPAAVMNRGYSVTRSVPEGWIIRDASKVRPGNMVDVRLATGTLRCRVEGVLEDGSKTDI